MGAGAHASGTGLPIGMSPIHFLYQSAMGWECSSMERELVESLAVLLSLVVLSDWPPWVPFRMFCIEAAFSVWLMYSIVALNSSDVKGAPFRSVPPPVPPAAALIWS